jgi:hypothetical protein
MDLVIFVSATLTALFAVGYVLMVARLEEIKQNWVKYRCNPIYMPFAGMVGQDVASNFTKCTMKSFQDYAGFIMDPIQVMFGTFLKMFSSIADSLQSMRQMFAGIRNGFLGIVSMIFGKIANTMATMQYLMIRIRTVFMRVAGIMGGMMNIMTAGVSTGGAIMNGPIVKSVSWICFAPETPVRLLEGDLLPIQHIRVGEVLTDGSVVTGKYYLSGRDEPLYSYKGILVTGSHRLENGSFVSDQPEAILTTQHRSTLVCLDTDTGLIQIGDTIFRDFEADSFLNVYSFVKFNSGLPAGTTQIAGVRQRADGWEVLVR